MVSALTAGDTQRRSAVEYVVGFLVNDTCSLMRTIISEASLSEMIASNLQRELEIVEVYLKYGFDARLRSRGDGICNCSIDDVEFDLNLEQIRETAHFSSLCGEFKRVFGFFKLLRAQLDRVGCHPTTLSVIDDCSAKARLYMGHRCRVVNQQEHIHAVKEEMRLRCIDKGVEDEAFVTIDFKMKLEPMYYREKTVDHYGKRGISWHGALVETFSAGGDAENEHTVTNKLYYDHLSDGDNKQDRDSVLSMIEAILIRLRQDLQRVNRIVMQSDNATCYQNVLIPLVLPHFSAAYGIEVVRFIHTETQDGKGILDAHFARSMGVLGAYVQEGNNCITPTQAVIGLKSHGGLPNCVVKLVHHNRTVIATLVNSMESMEKQIRRRRIRANDILISVQSSIPVRACSRYETCPNFTLDFYECSGIGNGIRFICFPLSRTCNTLSGTDNCSELKENDGENETVGYNFVARDDHDDRNDFEADNDVSDFDEYSSDTEPEVIDQHVSIGFVTGVRVATQGQLRRRTRRWRKPTVIEPVAASTIFGRDAISHMLRTALQMQHTGGLQLRDGRIFAFPTPEITADGRVEMEFQPGWAIRPKKGKMYGVRYVSMSLSNRGVVQHRSI